MLLVDDTWKTASHGKDKATVLAVVLQTPSNVSNENAVKSFVTLMPNFLLISTMIEVWQILISWKSLICFG